MNKELRKKCEALSLELFGKKNMYRKIEKYGLRAPTNNGLINIKLSDDEILGFLINYKAQKEKHEVPTEEQK